MGCVVWQLKSLTRRPAGLERNLLADDPGGGSEDFCRNWMSSF